MKKHAKFFALPRTGAASLGKMLLLTFIALWAMFDASVAWGQGCPSAGPVNQVANFSFEDLPAGCSVPPGTTMNNAFVSCAPTWATGVGTPSLCNDIQQPGIPNGGTISAPAGDVFACLAGENNNGNCNNESIVQTVNLCPGVLYNLSFQYANLGGDEGTLTVLLTDQVPGNCVNPSGGHATTLVTLHFSDVPHGTPVSWSTNFANPFLGPTDPSKNLLVFVINQGTGIFDDFNLGLDDISLTCAAPALTSQLNFTNNGGGNFNFGGSISEPPVGNEIWCWDFGDGTTGSGQNVSHTYAHPGYYEVCLSVMDGCRCTSSQVCTGVNFDTPCPCTEANTLNINASPNGTLYSVLEANQNFDQNNDGILDASEHHGCIAVTGRLLIDRDVSILNCPNVRMQPCSEIVVQGPVGNAPARHLTMEFNNIYGCEQMWRSVTVQPHARLTFRHNTVADAQYANWVNPASWLASFFTSPTQVDIQFNNYVRNHVDLNIPGSGGGWIGGVVWQTPFIGNDMLSVGPANPLLPACPLAVPNNYEQVFGYAGATISGANFNIGTAGGSANTFSNLRNGVVADGVFLNVDGANFTNMVGFLGIDMPSLDFSRGVGVAANGCFANVRDSWFDRAGHAMFLNGGLNTVQRNTTTQVRLGLETREPIGLWVLDKNNFGFLDFGIRARELAGSPNFFLGGGYRIDDNDFSTQDVQADINGDWAIQLRNTASTVMSENFASVSRNRIHINDQIAGGLQVTNQDAWGISDNRVDFTAHPNNVTLTGNGVNLQNSRYNRLYGNELNDVAGTAGGTIGFAVNTSVGNVFCCNSTNRNSIASMFTGECNGTDYRTTTMSSHDLSLFLPEGTRIGKQRSLTMTNSNVFGCNSGLAANDNVQTVILDSEFFVTDLTCPRHPQSVFPTTGWFTEIEASDVECGSDPQCTPVTYPRGRNTVEGSDLSIAQSLYPSTPRYAALHWEGTRDLYARLKQYPADMLGQSAAVDAFYAAAEQGSAIKAFYGAEVAIAAVREVPAAWGQALKTATDSINAIEQRTKSALVSLANVSTRADSLSVYWHSEALRSGIVVPMAVVLEKQHQLDSLRRARAAAALPAVLALPASSILQSNRKSVLRIYLEVTAAGANHLTAAQFATVKAVAEQCALEGGSAVYTARALYQMNEKRHFDDLALCGESQERSTSAQRLVKKGVALWPNPSTGRVQVFVPGIETEQSVHLRVTDVSGRVVLEQNGTTSDGNLLLDGSSLTPGIYFCQVCTTSEAFSPVKFAISL